MNCSIKFVEKAIPLEMGITYGDYVVVVIEKLKLKRSRKVKYKNLNRTVDFRFFHPFVKGCTTTFANVLRRIK